MPAVSVLVACCAASAHAQPDLRTVAEKSDYRATALHADVVALLDNLAAEYPNARRVSLGTSPEAETTAYYIARHLADWPGRITRFASGIPVGSDLEYVDPLTLARSLRERLPLSL